MKKAILIDLSSIAHPAWHISQADPNPDATAIKTVEAVRRFAGNAPFVAICCDSGRSFRKDIDPEYKATRPAQDAALTHQVKLAMDMLKQDGFPVWAVPNYEADDLIASAADLALAYYEKPDTPNEQPAFSVEILSSDKDLLQLVSPRVAVRSIATAKYYDEAGVVEKLGVAPHQVVDWLALVGDTSDNIKGAKGIGPKKATELLVKYGNLDDLYRDLHEHGTNFTPALATALQEFKPRLQMTRELITLKKNVPLPFAEIFKERTPEEAIFSGEDEAPESLRAPDPPPAAPATQPPLQFPRAVDSAPAMPLVPATQAGSAAAPPPALPPPYTGPPEPPKAAAQPLDARAHAGDGDGAAREAGASLPPINPPIVGPKPAPPASAMVLPPEDSSQALAPMEWRQQLEPRTLREAAWISEQMFKSRLFSAYGTPQGVLSTVLAGREFGLQTMASLRGFHIIDGKPSMSADLIRALVLKSGIAEYFRCTERTPTKATFVTRRRGDPEVTMTYTIEEARLAWKKDQRAWDNSGYGTNPADMLIARCGAKLARLVYPEVAFGLYAPSELTDVSEGVE